MSNQGNESPAGGVQTTATSTSFLHRPVAIVTVISGIVGTLTAVIGLVVTLGGNGNDTSNGNDTRAATATKDCVEQHRLSSEYQKDMGVPGAGDTILFRQCAWPPPHGADADGYSEISVSSKDGPGQNEAEGLTVADYLSSNCRDIRAVYLFHNMGTLVPEEPILIGKGEIRRVEGGSIWQPRNDYEAMQFSPGRDESIIMSNLRYTIESAQCV
jgi:hypothetical protein